MNEVNNSEFEQSEDCIIERERDNEFKRSEDCTIRVVMGRKGFIPVILITVLALVIAVGGVGIGLAWKTSRLDRWLPPNIKEMFGRGEKPEEPEEEPEEKPEEKPEEDPTKDWKTYTNTKGNYQLKVPEGFWIFVWPEIGQLPVNRGWVDSSDDGSVAFWGKENDIEMWYMNITYVSDAPFYNPPPETELISWLKEGGFHEESEEFQALEKPNFEIGGVPAVKIYEPGMMHAYDRDVIWVIKNGKLFNISVVVGAGGKASSEGFKKICDSMLSTFKFVE